MQTGVQYKQSTYTVSIWGINRINILKLDYQYKVTLLKDPYPPAGLVPITT